MLSNIHFSTPYIPYSAKLKYYNRLVPGMNARKYERQRLAAPNSPMNVELRVELRSESSYIPAHFVE